MMLIKWMKILHLFNMKMFILLGLLIPYLSVNARVLDKDLAQAMSNTTSFYMLKNKSINPNKGVVFMNSVIDPLLMKLEEVSLDRTNDINRVIVFNRPVLGQNIISCSSEKGSVAINQNSISVTVQTGIPLYPLRVVCYGPGQGYKEAFSTFEE